MSIVIGGHGLGLQDGSLGLLNRGDPTSNGTLDQRMQAYANVSDGNLVIQERDAFLPSRGEDFELVRTYNSRGKLGGGANWGWTWSTSISLSSHNDKLVGQSGSVEAYLLSYGDGSTLHFDLDAARNLWVATDGAGAYETLQVVKNPPAGQPAFTVTRADQTQILFDKIFTLTAIVDSNGVRTDFDYQGARLTRVRDDTGHVLNYQYSGSDLVRIVDEQNVTLVQYGYSAGQLISVTDRFGHVTTYTYVNNLLAAIDLPRSQVVNGQVQTFDPRRISFTYQELTWPDSPHVNAPIDTGPLFAVSEIVDPLGGKTTFDYNLRFASSMSAADRDARYHPVGSSYFTGGSTRVVDALGQSIDYSYDADGYLTAVVDQQGFQTTYTYGGKSAGDAQSVINQDNLLSIVDRNGSGATTSDSAYFRALRKDLGFAEFVASLTAANKTALLAKFTTKFTYDDRGNLLTQTDGLGNQTRYTYTSFNKVASMTAAMGNALASSDEAQYQQKRVELGYAALVGGLTPAHQDALRALYTTTNAYDAKQNLITRTDPGGDVTKFEYDVFGNLSKRIVYLDPNDLLTESKQQVTTYAYDGFGNNTSIIDGLGHTTFKTFDHFGNVLTSVDGRRGVTTFTYDADNRLLSAMDPEGHTTINTYDAVGNRISVTDANGHTITQVFDRNNLLIATIDPAVSDALTRTTRFTYDILGNNTETIDAEGRKHTYTFDSRRLLLDVATPGVLNDAGAPPVSYHTTYAYDGESNIVTLTDNNNNVTQTLYSANGLLKRVTDPIGNVTEYLYDANRQQVQVTIGAQQLMPALRRVLKFGRDEEDQLARTTDALGNVTEYLYDAPGTVASVTDANGNTTEFEYDKNNRMITETRASVIDPVTGLPTRYTVRHQYDANGNEVRTTDENYTTDDKGHFTTFSFDKDNRVVMVTDGNGIKTVFSYDARDNQTQIAIGVQAHLDADAHVVIDEVDDAAVTSFAYDEFNQLVSTTDAVGNALVGSDLELYQGLRTELGFAALVAGLSAADKTTLLNRYTERYEYDRVGNRTKLTDHLGRVTALSYDALDRLQSRTEAVGTPEQRSAALRYDGNANLVKQTDALGRTTELSYDGNDRLVGETDPLRAVTRHEYDHVGNLTASTEAFGSADARTTRFVYDLNNRLTQESDPEGHLRHYEYDAVGNRLKETDDRGGATEYVYDALNRTIKIIDPIAPFQTRFEYDGVGNTIKIIDPNGGIERMQYDGANRYIQTTDPMGRVMRLKYDVLDRVITQTTAFGLAEAEETRYVYDAEGNLRQVTDAAGNDSTQGFDEVYNLTRHTDNNGHTTTTAFDALNRQIRVTDALDGVTTYSYDLEDNRLTETDPLKRKRSFQYDAKDRLITQTDALGVQTTYAYDALDNRVRITRAANTADARTDTFDYNSDDKLIRQTDALGHVTTYAYDANHNVVSMKDANGHTTTYLYDAANRVTLIKDPLGNDTEYKYDGKGNRTQVLDARGNAQTTYYNGDDEVILTVDGEGNALAHSYDGNGNVIATRRYMTPLPLAGVMDPTQLPIPAPTPRPEDRITRFGYDQLNRLIERTDALGGISTMAYDAVGNKIAETDQNEHTTQYVYDDLDRLITQIDPLEGERSFTYDAVGNRLSVTDENDHTRSFVYDLKDRLVEETDPLDRVRTHTYDARDNRLSTTDENGHITRYAYDLDDRLISQTDPLGGVQTFTYDAVGNQTSVTDQNTHTTRFEYDADDRLISQTNPLGGVRTTVYDAVGNRVGYTDENRHTTTYVYDRSNRLTRQTDPLGGVRSFSYDAAGNQLTATDQNGHPSTFGYDANNRLTSQADALGNTQRYAYDAGGNRIGLTDENGHTTSFAYDANDRQTSQTDALGHAESYSYDAAGNRVSMTDENGNTTSFAYDANDRQVRQTDALGNTRDYEYDAVGNLASTTDENGHTTSFAYDANDRLVSQTDPLDGVRTMIYDAVGNMLSAADVNGHATNYLYDANDRLITQTDALGGKRSLTYDAVGNRLSLTDQNGHATTFAYDARNRLVSQTDALGKTRTFAYDAVGNRTRLTDENAHTTRFAYDAANRQVTETDALGNVQHHSYDAAGNVLSLTDENGHTTRFAYDARDRVIRRTDALGSTQIYVHDAVGNRTSLTDENGHTTTFAYDAVNRQLSRTDALGNSQSYGYDAARNRTSFTDENAHTTTYAYDALDRMVSLTDALGNTQTYAYDSVGNVTAQTDANGETTTYLYDANDRQVSRTDALGGISAIAYDAAGNQISMTDQNGHATTFAYDANDRQLSQTDALGKTRTNAYDAVGNRIGMTDENGHAATYGYDANDRQIRQTDALGGVSIMAYDAAGNRTSMTDENGHTTTYGYDANDRQVSQTDALGNSQSYGYDAAGNRTSLTDENGHTTSFAYDAVNRHVSSTDALGNTRTLAYDALGNRTGLTDENGRTTSIAYDAINRQVTRTDALGGVETYLYDAVGNRVSMTDEKGHSTTYAFDANDRLIGRTDALGRTQSHAYDAVGNRTSLTNENGHTTSFAYDALNRQVSRIDALGGVLSFSYDAVGNRLAETDENGHITTFTYDAKNRQVGRTDALGNTQTYAYDGVGNRTRLTDENGHITLYAYDANNRLTEQTDPLGGVMSRAYDAAGNKESETDANGHTTRYVYDANNRELSRTDALGATASCIYDAAGNKVSEIDENGHATTYAYDALNRLTSMVDALGFATSLRYDAVGNILATGQKLSLTNPSLEQINRHAYDALDRRVSSLSAEGFLKLFEYDAVGQLVKMTAFDNKFAPTAAGEAPLTGSGASRITVSSYDANDRLVSETSPLGFVTRYEYDAVGNRTAMTEAQGTAEARRTETHYDALNRTLETVDALGIVTHIVRDAAGNALEVHEAFGTPAVRVMHYQYDANDRLSQQTDALGVVSQFGYDGVGNLTERRAAVGLAEARTERFEYDANRRQTAQINGEGERTEYAYDGVGNRTTLIVAPGTLEQRINRFRYDADNRLIGETDGNGVETQYQYDGADNKVKTIQLAATYDSAGNPTGTYQGQPIIGKQRETLFAYDLDNRLTQVTDPMGGVTEYEVDALGNRTRITDAQGTQTLNTFDALGRLLTNWVQGAEHGGVLVTNRYDAFGNILETRRGFHDGADTRQTTYTYDQRNRQTTITEHDKVDNANAATVFSQAYSAVFEYDAFDNQTKVAQGVYRLTAADAGYDATKAALAHPLIAAFSYDRHDELLTSTDGVGNILAYENDAHGNRVSQTTGFGTLDARTVTFSYDRADRLIARRTPATGGVVKLSYDEAGNQSQKDTLQSGSEFASPVWVSERFAYDGNGRVVSQSDGLGVITEHVLDAFGNETATRFAAGTDDERTVRFEYNANNDLTAEIDALSNRTRFEVDKLGNRIAQTDALGFVTRLYYNALNQQIAALDAEGFLTTFSRDSAGNVLEIDVYLQQYAAPADHRTPPTPSALDTARVTRNEFDGAGNRVRKTEPDQRVKDFVYDSAGKLRQITDHGSSLAGALALTVDASPRVQRFEYDGAGRLTRFTQVDGVTEDFTYDSADNKIRETITNPHALAGGGSDPVRTTVYQYDADNRQTAQIFDPSALNQVQTLAHDKAGNVIAKTDALGHVTTMTYDLAHRMVSITDPLNGVISFGYDRVGNRTSLTDALGNVTLLEYDDNNRATRMRLPAVDVFTIRDGLQSGVQPTSETKYDAVGNIVQEIDAGGFKHTAFYDGNRNRIAEINGDNVLRTFSYDVTGLVNRASLYMTRVDAAAHDAPTPPALPSGAVRTLTSEYDAAGRLTRTVYPPIEKTTLSGVGTADPIASTATVTPEERHAYNAFGERVRSTDRNGQISYAYFDTRGRAVATVDAAGYLIESAYDDQGNVVQQRKYATPLDIAQVSAGTRPTPPAGEVFTVDRTYDAANRLIEERSPPAAIDGVAVPERIITRYAYDANGNQTGRTLAADSPEVATEYYYYDAANRQVAIVNDASVLHHIGYDANGNTTSVKRFIDPVSASVTLSTATLGELLADITADATRDQESEFVYDALNRESRLTDLMGPGSTDDISISSRYDANSNLSHRTDGEGYVTQTAYDALGHVTQTRSPDGNRSFIEYDAAGYKIRAWTGDLGSNQATAATNVTASIGNALSVAWEVSGNQLTSYLVYDTTPHDVPSAYASESGQQGSGAVSVDVALAGFSAGSIVYFRVVTVDAAGSMAWTDEFSITVPVLMSTLSVAQVGSNLEVTARFNGAVSGPELLFGSGQALNNTIAFVLQGDGSYKAIILNPAQGGQGLSYQVRWTANGSTFTTAATPFEAPGAHQAIDATFIWPVPLPAQGDAQIVLLGGARQENAFQVNGQLQFTPAALATGTHVYQVLYGQSVAEGHGFTVTNLDHQTTGAPSAPVVIPGGMSRTFTYQHNYSTRIEVALDPAEALRAAATLQVAYRPAGNTGLGGFTAVAVTRNVNTFSAVAALVPGVYDVKVSYIDAGREVIVQWRRITVEATALHAPTVQEDTDEPFNFAGLPSSFIHDVSTTALTLTGAKSMTVVARETDGEITQPPSPNANVSIDPGLYTGPVDPAQASFALPITTTGSAGASSAKADGLTAATYFTEIEYDALGSKIASNEETGLWRRFGVDANGNTPATRVFGTRADELAGRTPIVTYSAFDARNFEIARFGARASVDANGDGIEETTARAVSRVTYDYAGRKLTQLDPIPGALAQAFEYDGVGNLIRQSDGMGFATLMFYDRRGNEVRRVDARGFSQRFVYDAAGRKVQEIDALNNATAFAYDAFDRPTSESDALGHTTQMTYDQRDRLVQVTDANGNGTKFSYDKRDNRTWTEDANHHFFGQGYDAMGRVTNTYSFQSRTSAFFIEQTLIDALNITPTPTTLAQAIDAVGNGASPYRAALVNETIAYDIYGNKRSETDAEGRTRFYAYGAFGRLAKQTDEEGRVTSFGYDRFGRTISETRPKDATVTGAKNIVRTFDDDGRLKSVTDAATLVSTTYTYDVAGSRMHETVRAPNFASTVPVTARNITYDYDALGRMVQWSDSVVNKTLSYAYDAVGNQTRIAGSDSVDHRYSFDANNRVTDVRQGASTLIAAYTYDAAGNRKTYNDDSHTATYTYDAGDRVVRADITPNATPGDTADDTHMTWQYDAAGNVTQYKELAADNTTVKFTQTNRYTANNRTQQTSTNDQRDPAAKSVVSTLSALDKDGRVLIEGQTNSTDPDNAKTTTYTHVYSKDGRELSITATGSDDKTGNTTSTYDANDRLAKLDLGKGDGQDSNELRLFISNNDGQILRRLQDDGEDDTTNPLTQFLYANGHPVGQTGTKADGSTETVLDSGNYSLIDNIGTEFPAASVSAYHVRSGDTLQSIAAQLYGNPSLWFVIADANGLTGSEQLKAGTRLSIPNSTEAGRLTADTHNVYRESEIVGSKLPNLKSPEPSGGVCALIGAIILAILIAIAAIILTIVTVGLATPAAVALLGLGQSTVATMIVGVAIGVVVGTVVAAAASAITQGITIGFGLQREFNWKQFAGEIAGGVLAGIGALASGVGQAVIRAAQLSTNATRIAIVAAVSVDVALQVAGEAVSQFVAHDGHLEHPWMLGVAAAAGVAGEVLLGALQARAIRNIDGADNTGGDTPDVTVSAPIKTVTIADNPDVVTIKPVADVGKAGDTGVVSALKKVDIERSDADADGKATLDLKNPSTSLAANDNTPSMKPLTIDDNATSTLSGVQSPMALDKGADLGDVIATKKMISGETSSSDEKSVTDFAQGSVGKVDDKTVPIPNLAGDDVTLPAPATQTPSKMLVDGDGPRYAGALPRDRLQELLAADASNPQMYRDPNLPDYNTIPSRYFLPTSVQESSLPKPAKNLLAAFSSEKMAVERMKKEFMLVYDNDKDLAKTREINPDAPSRFDKTQAQLKQRIEDYRTGFKIEVGDKTVTIDADPAMAKKLEKVDPVLYAATKGYSDTEWSGNARVAQLGYKARLNKQSLDGKVMNLNTFKGSVGVADYNYLNPMLRGLEPTDAEPGAFKEIAKAFDAYNRLAVRGVNSLDPYQGPVIRGVDFSKNPTLFNQLYKEGDVFTEQAFMSTTRNDESVFRGDTLLVINSRSGRRIEGISAAPHELEVLFPAASQFKVLKIETFDQKVKGILSDTDENKRTRIVYLDELPPAPAGDLKKIT